MKRPNPIDPASELYSDMKENMSPRLRLAWDVAEETGLRVSDIIKLKAKNIHPGGIVVKESKTGKTRWVFPSDDLVHRLKLAADLGESQYCFPSPHDPGKPISRDTLGKEIRTLRKNLKIPDEFIISMHSARKNYAIDLLKKSNGDVALVQKALRHSKLETTLLYLYGAPSAK